MCFTPITMSTVHPQIIVVHGGDAFGSQEVYKTHLRTKSVSLERLRPRADWKVWLAEQLMGTHDVLAPRMPFASNAPYALWKLWFLRCAEVFTDEVTLVGHSLGGIFLAKLLSEQAVPFHVRALHLVSAPFETTDSPGELPHAWQLKLPVTRVLRHTASVHVYHSTDDPVVPYAQAEQYVQALPSAVLHTFENRGHFLDPTFPELEHNIRRGTLLQ
jgi:predicted alpha/beta hydrolase family esterase